MHEEKKRKWLKALPYAVLFLLLMTGSPALAASSASGSSVTALTEIFSLLRRIASIGVTLYGGILILYALVKVIAAASTGNGGPEMANVMKYFTGGALAIVIGLLLLPNIYPEQWIRLD